MGCASSVNSQSKLDESNRPMSMNTEVDRMTQNTFSKSNPIDKHSKQLSASSLGSSKVTIVTPNVSLQKFDEPKSPKNEKNITNSTNLPSIMKSRESGPNNNNNNNNNNKTVASSPSHPPSTTTNSSAKDTLPTNQVSSTNNSIPSTSTTATATATGQLATTQYKSIYKAIKIGTIILIRDSFYSKYSGKLMYKWREAEVADLDEKNPTKMFIHFIGWNPSFDVWIDIEEEIHKIAPIGLLTKPEIDAGVPLDTSQMQLVKYYLLTGHSVNQTVQSPANTAISSQPVSATSSTNNMSSSVMSSPHPYPSNAPSEVNSPIASRYYTLQKTFSTDTIYPPQSYDVCQPVDILDIFYRPGSDTPSSKWRKAKIIDKRETKIRITYIGWDSKFDETLDIHENANRISAFGTKSTEQASISAAAQRTPDSSKKGNRFSFNIIKSNPAMTSSTNPSVPLGELQENEDAEGGAEGGSNTEGEGDSNSDGEDNGENKQNQKDPKKKKAFGGSFGKMMTKAMTKLTTSGTTTKGSSNQTTDPQDTANNSQTNSPQNHHNNNTLLNHEPTAEEIAAFEAEINKEKVFLHTLQSNGYHVIEIEGDGNCLFRAISHQLYLNEEYHEQLRYFCVEHLKKHQKRFEKFVFDIKFEDYIEEMSKNGTWGDDIEIRAMEEILDRNIHIYSSSSLNPKDYLVPVNENPDEEKLMQGVVPINLSYHGQSHYNSIYCDRTPLPLPLRQTKVLLNARLALTEGRAVPVPISSSPGGALPSNNVTPMKTAPQYANSPLVSSTPNNGKLSYTPQYQQQQPNGTPNGRPSSPIKTGIVQTQANYLNNLRRDSSARRETTPTVSYHQSSPLRPTVQEPDQRRPSLEGQRQNSAPLPYETERRRPSIEKYNTTGNGKTAANVNVGNVRKDLPPLSAARDNNATAVKPLFPIISNSSNNNTTHSTNGPGSVRSTVTQSTADSSEESNQNLSLNYSAVYADKSANSLGAVNKVSSTPAGSYRSSSMNGSINSDVPRSAILRANNYPYEVKGNLTKPREEPPSSPMRGGIGIGINNSSKPQVGVDRMIHP